jgi:serine/threonine-protein kinase
MLASIQEGPSPVLVRDLKPANLIITYPGHVMLVDLGIACPIRRGEQVPPSVRGLGTPGYAPPEQVSGDGWEDARTDLFALGVILFRTATGRQPFRDTLWREFRSARALNPGISPGMDELLRRLLQPDAAQRPSTAAEVSEALQMLRARHPA